jgi:UDP-glucose:(heptosyl)LPS alpha-1,3-glucosyltransferase
MERELMDGRGARRIACVSSLVHREFADAYPSAADRLVLVPNGVDTVRFHPRQRATDSGIPLLGFSARQPELKGLKVVFEALSGLLSRPWMLQVVGPRDSGRWKRLARANGLPPGRVSVLPEFDPAVFASSIDVLLHPTWRDACGLVVLEALACGTPVVTTVQAGAAEVVRSIEQGDVLQDPGDVQALRSAIAARLDRTVDREAIRSAVVGRERTRWLASLETILLDLAARRAV